MARPVSSSTSRAAHCSTDSPNSRCPPGAAHVPSPREPIPADTHQHLADLSARCRQNGISFGIGLTPYESYLDYGSEARKSLQAKVRQIDEIGVNTLCILFDDMRGDVAGLAELQASVISDVCDASRARHFIVCPTYYSYDARLAQIFGSAPANYLRDLGRLVDSRIDFFWTGEKVISNGYSAEHLANVASDIGRKPFIWDNYIANDAKLRTQYLFLDPAAGSWRLAQDCVRGLAINPMNQAHLSKLALAGYMRVLSDAAEVDFAASCTRLCEPALAARLLADIDLLQTRGLDSLDPESRNRLSSWYATKEDDPYAGEIVAWLRGEYAFDPQCLTT